jgi:hypothetical protein
MTLAVERHLQNGWQEAISEQRYGSAIADCCPEAFGAGRFLLTAKPVPKSDCAAGPTFGSDCPESRYVDFNHYKEIPSHKDFFMHMFASTMIKKAT